jgi:CRISPR-associated protein (TIGR03984 family)
MADYREIPGHFPGKAWVYIVMYHTVEIGLWDGRELNLRDADFSWEDILELRVFDWQKEMRYTRLGKELKLRIADDSGAAQGKLTQGKLTQFDVDYVMYGERAIPEGDWTALSEMRGKPLYFPKILQFNEGQTLLWLKVRNYLRYNKVPVTQAPDQPPLEVVDYRFTGFAYKAKGSNAKEEVRL